MTAGSLNVVRPPASRGSHASEDQLGAARERIAGSERPGGQRTLFEIVSRPEQNGDADRVHPPNETYLLL